MRATGQDPDTAELVGINSRAVYARATAIAVATAAVAGMFLGIRSSFDPFTGSTLLIFAFEAVVIGGFGSALGNAGRWDRARSRPDGRRPDQPAVLRALGAHRLPGRARLAARRNLPAEDGDRMMSRSARRRLRHARGSVGTGSRSVSRARSALFAVALVFVPVALSQNATEKMTSLLILVLLAAMWNALAGYGGLVSIGQQGFIGIGAYGTVWLVNHGVEPVPGDDRRDDLLRGGLDPGPFLVLRFRGAQFAIGCGWSPRRAAILVSFDSSSAAAPAPRRSRSTTTRPRPARPTPPGPRSA